MFQAIEPYMPRAKTILQSDYPYNISGRCINQEWFNLKMPDVWNIFCDELYLTSKFYDMIIHSFVLMNNHFHLIASTPEANVDKCMHRFMGNTSRRLTEAGNRVNGTYGSRYYKSILQHPSYFLNTYKYNYFNPVKASIVNHVEDYPYSTLHGLLGRSKIILPIIDETLFDKSLDTLNWLNTAPRAKDLELVRKALKRPYFKSIIDPQTKKAALQLDQLI